LISYELLEAVMAALFQLPHPLCCSFKTKSES
jgi:hypothetical protein